MERKTKQRDVLFAVLEEAQGPMSPLELLEAAKRSVPGIGIATIYRNIKSFVDEGIAQPVHLPGEPDRYELSGKSHHHHFFCRDCKRTFEMNGCPGHLERLAPPGFEVDGHDFFLYGRCTDCKAPPPPRRKRPPALAT
ncbi:MAG TPA: transcriptional repressor [Kiritimatiellia bacterium]|nr:transcriptional repressor [Kiritimatiellia bacterium]